MRKIYNSILSLLLALVVTGCCDTIHEHPDEGAAAITLTMNVKKSGPELYKVIEYVGNDRREYNAKDYELPNTRSDLATTLAAFLAKNSIDLNQWDCRLVWELYNGTRKDISNGDALLMQRDCFILNYNEEMPNHTISFDAPAGQYTLLAWADFVPKGTTEDYYYDTEDMDLLTSDLVRRRACLDNDQRDCFAQAYDFTVEAVQYQGEPRHYETTLIRPQGRYVILANDYDKYLKLSNTPVEYNEVQVNYPTFINVDYSVLEQHPRDGVQGMSYIINPRTYEFDENIMVCVADDYSFVNGAVSYVNVNMAVYNPEGAMLSTNRNIEIPLYADRLTVVIGKFLASTSGSGGIKVDDGFEDEIVIPYAVDRNRMAGENISTHN